MRNIISVVFLSSVVFGANAASYSRPAMSGKMIMAAPRYTASVNQLNGMGGVTNVKENTAEPAQPAKPEVDRREAERSACINNNVITNNIGIANTFVWASRYSDTSNYSSMIEDIEHPENNVCFVRVELKSDDASKVAVNDIPAKYFMWGENIECGSWANADEIEQRILDARKGARVGGIVAASVGGAGLGVGAMELFGNKLIGGKVQGQKADEQTIYYSYLKELENNKSEEYNKIVDAIKTVSDDTAGFDSEETAFIKSNKQ